VASLCDIVFDCRRPAPLARFWAAVLDGYSVAPYDDAALERLRTLGVSDVDDDPTVLVRGADHLPRLWFQAVPESKTVKNRVHLDLRCVDAKVEAARLCSLGASMAVDQPNDDLITLLDPGGDEFCLLR
jgi:hypothetical protein